MIQKHKVHTRGILHPFQQLWLLILSLLSTDDFVCKTPLLMLYPTDKVTGIIVVQNNKEISTNSVDQNIAQKQKIIQLYKEFRTYYGTLKYIFTFTTTGP
jgi:hypothetical protein